MEISKIQNTSFSGIKNSLDVVVSKDIWRAIKKPLAYTPASFRFSDKIRAIEEAKNVDVIITNGKKFFVKTGDVTEQIKAPKGIMLNEVVKVEKSNANGKPFVIYAFEHEKLSPQKITKLAKLYLTALGKALRKIKEVEPEAILRTEGSTETENKAFNLMIDEMRRKRHGRSLISVLKGPSEMC